MHTRYLISLTLVIATITLLLGLSRITLRNPTNTDQQTTQVVTSSPPIRSKVCESKTPNPYKPKPVRKDDFLNPNTAPKACSFDGYKPNPIKELDFPSCRRVSEHYIVDKNHVYKQVYDPGSMWDNRYEIVKEADPQSFRYLAFGVARDATHLFYDNGYTYSVGGEGLDLRSLQILSTTYSKDKNGIYQGKTLIRGFDIATFTILQSGSNHENYFRDKNGIYFARYNTELDAINSKINDADPSTFEVMEAYLQARDKNNVYYEGKIVEGLVGANLEEMGSGYYRDNQHVYYYDVQPKNLLPADGCTFVVIQAKTHNGPDYFTHYAKDKNNVYYDGFLVKGADANTFQVQGEIASDKNYYYYGERRAERRAE